MEISETGDCPRTSDIPDQAIQRPRQVSDTRHKVDDFNTSNRLVAPSHVPICLQRHIYYGSHPPVSHASLSQKWTILRRSVVRGSMREPKESICRIWCLDSADCAGRIHGRPNVGLKAVDCHHG